MMETIHHLLQDCFLYQSLSVDISHCKPKGMTTSEFKGIVSELMRTRIPIPSIANIGRYLVDPPETVFAMCTTCKQSTPFNPTKTVCLFDEEWKEDTKSTPAEQTFVFPYKCQGCKSENLVFLVRRMGLKFQLVGRSQIDSIPLPLSFPKKQQRLFVEALIADRTNNSLAAVCLLRIAIEAHIRSITQCQERLTGEALWENYKQELPSVFPLGTVKTLDVIYGHLSEVMHLSMADPHSVFEESWSDLERFFDLLKLYPLRKKQ